MGGYTDFFENETANKLIAERLGGLNIQKAADGVTELMEKMGDLIVEAASKCGSNGNPPHKHFTLARAKTADDNKLFQKGTSSSSLTTDASTGFVYSIFGSIIGCGE